MNKELKHVEIAVAVVIIASIFILLLKTPSGVPAGIPEVENRTGGANTANGDAANTSGQPIVTGSYNVISGLSGKESMVPYSNPAFNLNFAYPSSLDIKTDLQGNSNNPHFSVELTKKLRASIGTNGIEAIETEHTGTRITVDVRFDLQGLSIDEWVKKEPTWSDARTRISTIQVQDMQAYTYEWLSDLEGKTVIIPKDGRVYTLTVNWSGPEDQIVKDFDMILNNLSI